MSNWREALEAIQATPSLRPLYDRVLIRPEASADETQSGLTLVEHKKPEQMGTVLACGPQCVGDVQPGDLVIFSWAVGQEVWLHAGEEDAERFLLMRECDIAAVVEA